MKYRFMFTDHRRDEFDNGGTVNCYALTTRSTTLHIDRLARALQAWNEASASWVQPRVILRQVW